MFLSTVIPTIGREKLSRAVDSVLAQDLQEASFEVIVVNDSGRPLKPAGWQRDPRVRILETPGVERSAARNAGAAAAEGRYLHVLDDDDWLAPGAHRLFWETAGRTGAGFIYGRTMMVGREGEELGELCYEGLRLVRTDWRFLIEFPGRREGNALVQVMAGEFISIMGCIFRRDIFQRTGGFYEPIACAEDVDIVRHMALYSDLVHIPERVAHAELGSRGSTTRMAHCTDESHRARERILDKAETFGRLLDSAYAPYWSGRVLRTYLSAAWWNLRRGRWLAIPRRLAYAAAALVRAGGRIFDRTFWQGLRIAYVNEHFMRIYYKAQWW